MAGRLIAYVRSMVTRGRAERELDEELRFHIEMETQANQARGMTWSEARRRAFIDVGGVEQVRENVRAQRSTLFDGAAKDLQYAVRTLRHRPGFTLVAVLVLTSGIAANVAMFTLVNAVLLRELPVASPEQLVFLYTSTREGVGHLTHLDYLLIQRDTPSFTGVLATRRDSCTLRQFGEPELLNGESVSANYFSVLGVAPRLGRPFSPGTDDDSGGHPVVVISDRLWRTRFNADPGVLGKTLELDRRRYMGLHGPTRAYTIVGVGRAGFRGMMGPLSTSDYWVPLQQRVTNRTDAGFDRLVPLLVVARLAGADGWRRLEQDLAATSATLRQEGGVPRTGDWSILALDNARVSLPFDARGQILPERLAASLMLVSGIVLLIGAANLTGLLMARAVTRRRETGVRLALGASRWRIVRELLAEGGVLGLMGGVCSLPVASLLTDGFVRQLPALWQNKVLVLDAAIDWRVLGFAAGLALMSALLVSLTPALRAARTDLVSVLGAGEAATAPPARARVRRWILVAQVCLSLALLVLATGPVRAVLRAEREDAGYDGDGVVLVHFTLPEPEDSSSALSPEARHERRSLSNIERHQMMRGMLARVSELPGVGEAALAWASFAVGSEGLPLPLSSSRVVTSREFPRGPLHGARSVAVTPEYISALRLRLLRGRTFDDRDNPETPPVAIVSQALAARLWPGKDPIGERFGMAAEDRARTPRWTEVVGVVSDVRLPLADGPIAAYYTPLSQSTSALANVIVVRGLAGAPGLAEAVKDAARQASPRALVGPASTIDQAIREVSYPRRMAASVLGIAGAVGLLLALIGMYGVVAYSVATRVKEIGIRAALGAGRDDILRLLLREGALVVLLGSGLGLLLAAGGQRLASTAVVGLPPLDWVTIVILPLAVGTMVLMACGIPAWRATRTDPTDALRAE